MQDTIHINDHCMVYYMLVKVRMIPGNKVSFRKNLTLGFLIQTKTLLHYQGLFIAHFLYILGQV